MKTVKWNVLFAILIVSYTVFSALYTFVIPTTKTIVKDEDTQKNMERLFGSTFPGSNPSHDYSSSSSGGSTDVSSDDPSIDDSSKNGDSSSYSGTYSSQDAEFSSDFIDDSSYYPIEDSSSIEIIDDSSSWETGDSSSDPIEDSSSSEIIDDSSSAADSSSSDDQGGGVPVEEDPTPTYFTDEPVLTETSYSDQNIYISIKTVRIEEFSTTAYVADVRVKSAAYLKTAFANDRYGRNQSEYNSVIAASKNAILSINGDNYGSRSTGYVIRNGEVYQDTPSSSREVLAINADGTFYTFKHSEYTADELYDMFTWQAFSFGPALINDGQIIIGENAEVSQSDRRGNPRTAIGMIEPLHYIFVVSDGRSTESPGLTLYELATFMQSYGVKVGYNLDGGGSTSMVFDGRIINKPTADGIIFKERRVTDIVYIGY